MKFINFVLFCMFASLIVLAGDAPTLDTFITDPKIKPLIDRGGLFAPVYDNLKKGNCSEAVQNLERVKARLIPINYQLADGTPEQVKTLISLFENEMKDGSPKCDKSCENNVACTNDWNSSISHSQVVVSGGINSDEAVNSAKQILEFFPKCKCWVNGGGGFGRLAGLDQLLPKQIKSYQDQKNTGDQAKRQMLVNFNAEWESYKKLKTAGKIKEYHQALATLRAKGFSDPAFLKDLKWSEGIVKTQNQKEEQQKGKVYWQNHNAKVAARKEEQQEHEKMKESPACQKSLKLKEYCHNLNYQKALIWQHDFGGPKTGLDAPISQGSLDQAKGYLDRLTLEYNNINAPVPPLSICRVHETHVVTSIYAIDDASRKTINETLVKNCGEDPGGY